MSLIDTIFGQGGIDARFSDWDTARNFVIFDAIVNNPRLDDATKIKLQDMEQDAYEASSGQLFKTETQEIGDYYNYLKNNFPSLTNDAQFLAIFDAADQVKAGETQAVDPEDFVAGSKRFGGVLLVGLFALGALAVFTRD